MSFEKLPFPEFSWSHSRERTLAECARAYRHAYYTAHNGWAGDADPLARTAYRLKQLTTLDLALGTAIHTRAREMANAIRAGRAPPPLNVLRQRTRDALNSLVVTSRRRTAFVGDPKRVAMLLESYYERALPPNLIDRIAEKLERCLYFLHTSPIWGELRALAPSGVILLDALNGFDLDGVMVYAVPDLLYRCEDVWTIVDWKTGPAENAVAQLAVYALYVEHALHVRCGDGCVRGRVITLVDGHDETYPLGTDDLERALGRVRSSIGAMRALLDDEVQNVPKELSAFPLTTDPHLCWRCRFFELCRDELRSRRDNGVEGCAPAPRRHVESDGVARAGSVDWSA